MTLTLYRRHLHGCEAGRPKDTRSTERDERQKGWGRKCACPIYVSGTLGGRFDRTSTLTPDWERAHTLAASYEQAQVWTRPSRTPSTPAADPPSEALRPARAAVALVDACALFVSHREAAGLALATLKKYRTFTKQLSAFAATRGYRHVDQFTPDDVDLFWIN